MDAAGQGEPLVAAVLGEAVRTNPGDVELQSRWLGFLVTRPSDAAMTEALDLASEQLSEEGRQRVFAETALNLLYRAEIEQALTLIETLPVDDRFSELRAFAEALQLAALDEGYVPGPLLRRGWQKDGPFLLPDEHEGKPLRSWLAGRIEEIEDDTAYLAVAHIEAGELRRGSTEIGAELWQANGGTPSLAELAQRPESESRPFCELGIYDDQTLLIAVHPVVQWQTPQPPLPIWRYQAELLS